ncbi:MAG: hypothetical protein R3E68_18030 [Burkholderiaceae bacterium]
MSSRRKRCERHDRRAHLVGPEGLPDPERDVGCPPPAAHRHRAGLGQDKATTLRLLEVLAREGFVVRDPLTKHYSLGPEPFLLGAAAAARHDPRPIARPSLLRLAAAFQDTVILSVPRGPEAVCVDLELGRFPIRANYLEVGSRRPLGAGAAAWRCWPGCPMPRSTSSSTAMPGSCTSQ